MFLPKACCIPVGFNTALCTEGVPILKSIKHAKNLATSFVKKKKSTFNSYQYIVIDKYIPTSDTFFIREQQK